MSETIQATTEPIQLSITNLISDLRNGITRCKGDGGYNEERGSIQEKYGLTKAEVKEVFRHDKLLGLKVRIPKSAKYVLVDDTTENDAPPTVPEFGAPSAAATTRLEANEENKVDHQEDPHDEAPATANAEEGTF